MEQELFQRFIRRTDNIGQVISASDINALQEVLEAIQKEKFRLRDRDFLDNATFILENHPEFNRLLVENFNNQNKIDYTASRNIAYIEEETAISINRESDALEAVYESVFWQIPVSKVMLLVSDYQPEGSSIEYYISTQYGIWEPIVPSQIKEVTGSFVKIRATIRRSNPDIHPTINNWALLIKDPSIIETADLPTEDGTIVISHNMLTDVTPDQHHPKIHRHSGEPGENDRIDLASEVKNELPVDNITATVFVGTAGGIGIERDAEDRVTKITGPDEDVYLYYNTNGALSYTVTHNKLKNRAVTEVINYAGVSNIISINKTIDILSDTYTIEQLLVDKNALYGG